MIWDRDLDDRCPDALKRLGIGSLMLFLRAEPASKPRPGSWKLGAWKSLESNQPARRMVVSDELLSNRRARRLSIAGMWYPDRVFAAARITSLAPASLLFVIALTTLWA
ncbi:hypothetical protein EVAR_80535_1 [Eumeta japonica]|uniref:Uncharacterized protein n=1 Tax=Eumeta variegata TaxID=151549 RepID=A0A4C1TMA4_EUMVA|nr:hypothetical protein EVAR_80535_1 [Eumeta japonica]